MSSNNPYSAPNVVQPKKSESGLPPADEKKVEAIIKDANQFWLAIIICIFCSGLGLIIIPIWYTARLFQHGNLASKYPTLNRPAQPGSLAKQFQNARVKLIIGLALGCCLGVVIVATIALSLIFG